jgi:MOSC domain-containing protein YiiM
MSTDTTSPATASPATASPVGAFTGEIVGIYVAPAAGAPMEARSWATVVAHQGIAGDRYARGAGSWSANTRAPRDITLIEREAIDAARAELGAAGLELRGADTRRNLVTVGVPVHHLIDRTFRIGDVLLRGVKLSEPCAYLEQLLHLPGVREALAHRAGIQAEVLTDGELRVGDPVTPT